MNLKGTVLSERSQSQKDKSCMIPLIKTECRMELSEGQRNGNLLFSGYKRVLVLQDEKNSVDGWWWWPHNEANVLKTTELCT